MTIIVTKPGIIIDVVAPTSMTKNHDKNGLFVLGGPETQLHDILPAVHDEKTVVEARVRKISVSFQLRWVVGVERCASLSYTRARGVRRWALTEPERGVGL